MCIAELLAAMALASTSFESKEIVFTSLSERNKNRELEFRSGYTKQHYFSRGGNHGSNSNDSNTTS
jgi:hypothetical protein